MSASGAYTGDYYNTVQNATARLTFGTILIGLIIIAILVCFGSIALNEAKKQGRNEAGWFVLGLLFSINAFIALKLSKYAKEEGHSITLWSVLGLFFGAGAIIALQTGINAENKLHDFDCWVILGFSFGLFVLLISCFLKPFELPTSTMPKNTSTKPTTANTQAKTSDKGWFCTNCGKENKSSSLFCAYCGKIKP